MSNGQIKDGHKAAILREFTARSDELGIGKDDGPDHTWQWTEGIYVFPDGRCPYCREPITSNRIWKIVDRMLVARWKVDQRTGRLIKERSPSHPHVNGSGICQGSARTAADALFTAMNPNDAFNSTSFPSHLEDVWDHPCPTIYGSVSRRSRRPRQQWFADPEAGQAGQSVDGLPLGSGEPELDLDKELDEGDEDDSSDDDSDECFHDCCRACCIDNGCPGEFWLEDDSDED